MSQTQNILYNRNVCVLLNSNIPNFNWCIQYFNLKLQNPYNTNQIYSIIYCTKKLFNRPKSPRILHIFYIILARSRGLYWPWLVPFDVPRVLRRPWRPVTRRLICSVLNKKTQTELKIMAFWTLVGLTFPDWIKPKSDP